MANQNSKGNAKAKPWGVSNPNQDPNKYNGWGTKKGKVETKPAKPAKKS